MLDVVLMRHRNERQDPEFGNCRTENPKKEHLAIGSVRGAEIGKKQQYIGLPPPKNKHAMRVYISGTNVARRLKFSALLIPMISMTCNKFHSNPITTVATREEMPKVRKIGVNKAIFHFFVAF